MTIEATLERIATALETIANKALIPEAAPEAPKAPRQKKAAASQASTSEQPSSPQTQKTAEESSAQSSEKPSETSSVSDDLFGEEPKAEEPKKETKVKPATQDDVRNALVEVQTALKSKDAAIDILKKHTTGNVGVLSKLPESAYAALIKECKDAVAKAPK